MRTFAFLNPSDPLLSSKAHPVENKQIEEQEFQELLDALMVFASGEQKDQKRQVLVGLAAPQVGIMKRIIIVDVKADGKGNVSDLNVFLNPEIIEKSEEEEIWYEGCYSTFKIAGVVSRSRTIRVKYISREGQIETKSYSGYVARIFQHEIDHLEGIRFPERIKEDKFLHWVEPEDFFHYRNEQGWRTWQRLASRQDWRDISGR